MKMHITRFWFSGFATGVLFSLFLFLMYLHRHLVTFDQPYSLMVENLTVEMLKKCGIDDNCMDIMEVNKK